MSQIALVTDSTAYIPDDLVEKYKITVIPQILVWGNETYRDGVDICPDEFYTRLRSAKVMPSSSQATPNDFKLAFDRLLAEDLQILTVVVSGKLSGTLNSALQARETLNGAPVEVVDSETTAMAMGFQVLAAARAAAQGASLAECKALVESTRPKVGVLFAVDTLDFLYRGGRIGGASHLLGTALGMKPILEVRGGRVEAVEKIRTRRKSLNRLVELVREKIGDQRPVRLATLHANAYEEARELLDCASEQIDVVEKIFSEVSPVVGTHAGPGTVGLAYMAG